MNRNNPDILLPVASLQGATPDRLIGCPLCALEGHQIGGENRDLPLGIRLTTEAMQENLGASVDAIVVEPPFGAPQSVDVSARERNVDSGIARFK